MISHSVEESQREEECYFLTMKHSLKSFYDSFLGKGVIIESNIYDVHHIDKARWGSPQIKAKKKAPVGARELWMFGDLL